MILHKKNTIFNGYLNTKKGLSFIVYKNFKEIKLFEMANIKTIFDLKNFIIEFEFKNKAEKLKFLNYRINLLYDNLNNSGIKDLFQKEINSDIFKRNVTMQKHFLTVAFRDLFKKDIQDYDEKLKEERFRRELDIFLDKYIPILQQSIFNRKTFLEKDDDTILKEQSVINYTLNALWLYLDSKCFNFHKKELSLKKKSTALFNYPLFLFLPILIPADGIQKKGSYFSLVSYNSNFKNMKEKTERESFKIIENIKKAKMVNDKEEVKRLNELYMLLQDNINSYFSDIYIYSKEDNENLSKVEEYKKELEIMLLNNKKEK